jgi:hypothetical protein
MDRVYRLAGRVSRKNTLAGRGVGLVEGMAKEATANLRSDFETEMRMFGVRGRWVRSLAFCEPTSQKRDVGHPELW